jgi:hypothetical protein
VCVVERDKKDREKKVLWSETRKTERKKEIVCVSWCVEEREKKGDTLYLEAALLPLHL